MLGDVLRLGLLGRLLGPGAARRVDSSQGPARANAAGSIAHESMREFSRASRGAGASGVVHVQVLGRACVFALSLRLRQPVYG